MRLCVVTQFPGDPKRPVGGVEAVSVNLVEALAAHAELDVQVVTLADDQTSVDVETWQGAEIHRLPTPPGSMLSMAIGAGRRLISDYVVGLRPDVVHAHDTYGLMVQGLEKLPRVFTVHGFIYGDTLVSRTRFARLRSIIWKWVETRGWADQPHIISISPYVRERVSRYSEANIRDIDNPVAPKFFSQTHEPEPGRLFSAAVISPRKNTHRLVEAVGLLVERGEAVSLRLAGPVTEASYGEALDALIRDRGLGNHVQLLGSISSDDVVAEMCRAQVFALVSLEENSPMGIEEAMAIGLPVVSSNRCGMPYLIEHGVSGYLVDPHDPAHIAASLSRAMAAAPELGRASREIAERRFHPDVVARKTLDLYREIS